MYIFSRNKNNFKKEIFITGVWKDTTFELLAWNEISTPLLFLSNAYEIRIAIVYYL